MIGKIAFNKSTGNEIGKISGSGATTWIILNKFGQDVEIGKDDVIFDSSFAAKVKATESLQSSKNFAYSTDGRKTEKNSSLPALNKFVGILCFAGGVLALFSLWPDKSALPAGYEFKSAIYVPAINALFSGLVSALVFFNFAALLEKD